MQLFISKQNLRDVSISLKAVRKSFFVFPAMAMAFFSTATTAPAMSGTWTGGTDSTWAGANWSASPVPSTGDTATFNASSGTVNSRTTIDLGAGVTINTVLFDSANAAAYTVGAGAVNSQTLTLNNGGAVTMNSSVANNELFNAAIVLGTDKTASTYTLTNNSANSLTFAGTITGNNVSGTAGAKVISVAGTGNIAFNGVISNGGASSVGITQAGTGTLTLTAADTYTGTTKIGNSSAVTGVTPNSGMGAGTVKLDFSASGAPTSNILSASSPLELGGGTLIIQGSNSANVSQQSGNVTFDSGLNTISLVAGSGGNNVALNLGQISGGTTGLGNITGLSTTNTVNTLLVNNASGIVSPASGATLTVNGNTWGTSAATSASLTYSTNETFTGATTAVNGTQVAITASAPTGLSTNTTYYEVNASGNTYQLSATPGGTAISNSVTAGSSTITTSGALTGLASYTSNTGTVLGTTTQNVDVVTNTSVSGATNLSANTLRFNQNATDTITLVTGVLDMSNNGSGNNGSGILVTNAVGSNTSTITGGSLKIESNRNLQIFNYDTTGAATGNGLIINSNLIQINNGSGVDIVGGGLTTLGGFNTYQGATFVDGGTLSISSNANLGSAPAQAGNNTPINTLAALNLDGTVLKTTATMALDGTATTGAANSMLRGVGIGTSGATFSTGANNLTINGVMTGAGTLTKGLASGTESGTLTLGGANSLTGATVINGGVLAVAAGAGPAAQAVSALGMQTSATFSSGATAGTSIVVGSTAGVIAGQLFVGSGITPGTTVASVIDGTHLTLSAATTAASSSSYQVYVNPPTNVSTTFVAGATSMVVGSVTNAKVGEAVTGPGIANGTIITAISGNTLTLSQATTGNSSTTAVSSYAFGGDNQITVASTTNVVGGQTIAAATGQSGFVTGVNSTSKVVTLSAVNSTMTTGITAATFGGAWQSLGTGAVTIANVANTALDISAATGTTTIASLSGGGTTGGNVILGTAASVLSTGSDNTNTTFGGILSGNGTLTKQGTGTWTLSGANTYTGTTTLSAGSVLLNNALALQNSIVTVSAGTGTTGTNNGLQFNAGLGDAFTIGGLSGSSNEALLDTGGNAVALTVGNNNDTGMTYSGALSGSGSLIKTGTGTQTVSGTDTYTGGTTISAGTLQFGKLVSMSATGAVSVASGATLAVNAGSTGEWSGTGTTAGSIAGLFNGVGGQTGGTVSLTSGATIGIDTSNASGAVVVSSPLVGTGIGLTKFGVGTLTLSSGANTYTGSTTAAGGTLDLSNQLAIQNSTLNVTTGAVAFDSSVSGNAFTIGGLSGSGNVALQNNAGTPAAIALSVGNNNASTSYSGVLNGAGSLLKIGTGALTLNGATASTYTGGTTVSGGGGLVIDESNITGNSNLLLSTGTLTLAGGNLTIKGASGLTVSQTFSSIALAASTTNTITLNANTGTAANLTSTAALTRNTGSTLFLDLSNAGTGVFLTNLAANTFENWSIVKDSTGTGFGTTNASLDLVRAASTVLTATNPTSSSTNFTTSGAVADTATPVSLNTLFIDTTGGSGGWDLGGHTATFANGAIGMNGGSNYSISDGTITNSPLLIENVGTGTLTISATLTGSSSVTLNGGNALISGANTMTNGGTVNAGTLQVGVNQNGTTSGAFGSQNNSLTVNGGTLDLNGKSVGVGTFTGTGGTITNTSATTATLTIGNNNSSAGSSTVIADGSTAGNVAIVKTGSGTWQQNVAITSTGGITLAGGELNAHANGAFGGAANVITVTGNASFFGASTAPDNYLNNIVINPGVTASIINDNSATYSGNISGGSTATLSIVAGGHSHGITLSGDNSGFTGTLSVLPATGVTTNSIFLNTATAGGGAGVVWNFQNGSPNNTIGIELNSGAANTTYTAGEITSSGTGTGLINLSSGATPILLVGDTTLNTATYAGVISGAGLALTKTGTDTQVLTGASSFTGATTINGGTLALTGGSLTGTSGVSVAALSFLTESGSGSIYSTLALNVSGTATLAGANNAVTTTTINSGGLVTLGDGTNNGLLAGTIVDNGTFAVNGGTTAETVSNITSGTGSVTLASAAGTNVNTFGDNVNNVPSLYSGGTTVTSGVWTAGTVGSFGTGDLTITPTANTVVNLASSSQTLGTGAHVTVNNGTGGVTGQLQINDTTEQIASLAGNGSVVLANSGNGTLLTVGDNVTNSTFSGVISEASGTNGGALVKTGTDTLTLTGANTYTNKNHGAAPLYTTEVAQGILNAQNSSALGSGLAGVDSGATLQLQAGINVSNALKIAGTGASGSTGALENVSGSNTYSGAITLTGNTMISSDAGNLDIPTTGGAMTGSGKNLTLTGAGNGSIEAAIQTGSGTLTKSSTGTWIVAGANTFTGATQVNSGVLSLTGSLASGSTVTVGGGVGSSGTPMLNGTGTVNGNVIVASAGGGAVGTITPGTASSLYGTLHVGGTISFQTGSVLALNMSGASSTGELVIGGAATISSGADISINVGTTLSGSSYVLATAASGLNSATPFTVLGSLPSGYQLVYTGTALDLNQIITVTNGQYTLTSTPASLNVHISGTTTVATVIANTGTGTQDALNYNTLTSSVSSGGTSGSLGTASGTVSGSNLAQGTNNSPGASQTFTATSTAGNVALTNSSTVTNVTASGTPAGTNTGAPINVYSGLSTWQTNGGGSWSTAGTGAFGAGANWGANQGAPGVTSGFVNTDTATFDTTATPGTISLNGANPSLKAITFNNSAGGYLIAKGSGGTIKLNGSPATITDSAGNNGISAPVELDSNATATVSTSGNTLTISGAISESGGSRSFGVSGPGTTILMADNSYSGGTTVTGNSTLTGATLYVNNTGGASYSAPTSSSNRTITATNVVTMTDTASGTGTGKVTVGDGTNANSGTLAGSGTIASTSGGVEVQKGGTLSSGGIQSGTTAGTGLTINNAANLSNALVVDGGATLTFALGSTTAYNGGSGALNFGNPNTNSTFLSLTGTTTDQIFSNTTTADNINLVDLTNGSATVSLTLRAQNPYLLIQTDLGNNADFANLVTTGGTGANGYILGVSNGTGGYTAFNINAYDINGNMINSSSNLENMRLYLYNGDLEVVPEPGTWALMVGGLALLIVIQRRRRNN
jgi:fibronectin-binding autotransporter adhesin